MNLNTEVATDRLFEEKGQTCPKPTLLPIPKVILEEKVSTSMIAVGKVMDIEQVLDVGRVTAGSWQKLMMGEESNPKGGMQLDPVVNCNTFSKAICTFLGSMLRKTLPST